MPRYPGVEALAVGWGDATKPSKLNAKIIVPRSFSRFRAIGIQVSVELINNMNADFIQMKSKFTYIISISIYINV